MELFYLVIFAIFSAISAAETVEKEHSFKAHFVGHNSGGDFPRFPDPFGILSGFQSEFPYFHLGPFSHVPFSRMSHWPEYVPWYKGSHVCPSTRILREHIHSKMSTAFESMLHSAESTTESCRPIHQIYVCVRRTHTNEGSEVQVTLFKCCPGYTRHSNGNSGCVKDTATHTTSHTQTHSAQKMKAEPGAKRHTGLSDSPADQMALLQKIFDQKLEASSSIDNLIRFVDSAADRMSLIQHIVDQKGGAAPAVARPIRFPDITAKKISMQRISTSHKKDDPFTAENEIPA